MRMQKRKFRIGEFAKHLDVERFVIRFWEKEFSLKTDRSIGGQRFYSEEDLAMFKTIKELLYQKGFTIAGAKQQINTHNGALYSTNEPKILASKKTNMHYTESELLESQKNFEKQKNAFMNQLLDLHKKLRILKDIL